MKIYLDMDGVIVDFVGAALRVHRAEDLYNRSGALGEFHIERLLSITPKEFWDPINDIRYFWKDLAKTSDADDIVRICTDTVGVENIAILTSPDPGDDCLAGKVAWINQCYPQFRDRLTFAQDKSWYAAPGYVLVDDKDSNVEGFREAGGGAILVPRVWNAGWPYEDVASSHIARGLQAALLEEVVY